MNLPKIVDNNRISMLEVLKRASQGHSNLSIATGYWDLKAITSLMEEFNSLNKIRLLIGREPMIPRNQIAAPEKDFPTKDFVYDLTQLSPSAELRTTAEQLNKWLIDGKIEVKIYRKSFMHAKCYIFGDYDSDSAVGVIGSSNFTNAGLTHNTELNALESDHRVITYRPSNSSQETGHLSWFDGMWNDELTEDWNKQFKSIIELSPLGDVLYSPFEMYIKTLYNFYQEELQDDFLTQESKLQDRSLFEFQLKNSHALQRRLKKYKVAMLSDSVGLGKTITAINVIKNYLEDEDGKKRVEIICPKSIVQQWEKELTSEGIFGNTPITLQNPREIESKRELDTIAAVSLFVIDESHNLRQSTGVRFQQLLEWIRNNPKAHVLLLTATPINNNLTDLTTQILLGTGGDAEVMKITVSDEKKQTVQITFHQAVDNLRKKINQDLKRNGKIDFSAIREVMSPIIRTFVVRRTRQGIQSEYGSLEIDGVISKFPSVVPEVIEYTFSHEHTSSIRNLKSKLFDISHIYKVSPNSIIDGCKDLRHPISQIMEMEEDSSGEYINTDSPMFYIFQLILTLGFIPYRWMVYQTKYYGKTREQIRDLGMGSEVNKRLMQQLSIFGILRTVFLKRMESSVSALRLSLDTYARKLEVFELAIRKGKIVSIKDLDSLENIFGDDDVESDDLQLEDSVLDDINSKTYKLDELLQDILYEKELVRLLGEQLRLIDSEDSKIKTFAQTLDKLRENDPDRKILIFSYFSDTITYLKNNIFKYSRTAKPENSEFVTSSNRSDSENIASRFSPKSKRYQLKEGEDEINTLFSTDVLSEGQNLQDAGVLLNYDLHWNPVRMIQRNGRINRIGSSFDVVRVFNMRPESKLDSYLKLIQRLQGKIDIIRNTIGTDTPVLDEIENPIEYTDALSDIYSSQLEKRINALLQAEKASDFLLSEDEFVMDLKKFAKDESLSNEYRQEIFNIPAGKWGGFPNRRIEGQDRPSVLALSELISDTGKNFGYQFVETNFQGTSIKAISQMQGLHWLRTDIQDNTRERDDLMTDRELIKNLVESKSTIYMETEEEGSLIGQENDILRLMFSLAYDESDINLVRRAFKTKDVFLKREITQLKTQIIRLKNKNNIFQNELIELVAKAKTANRKKVKISTGNLGGKLSLAYFKISKND
jgi:ERCC4-related helicase